MAGNRARSASTGRFVKRSTLKCNPKTTLHETVNGKKSGSKKKR